MTPQQRFAEIKKRLSEVIQIEGYQIEGIGLLEEALRLAREGIEDDGWISVAEELPEPLVKVLAFCSTHGAVIRQRGPYDNDWFDEHGNSTMGICQYIEHIIYWRHLPTPPDTTNDSTDLLQRVVTND